MDHTPYPDLPKLRKRPVDGHKGTFGTVGIIGGAVGSAGDAEHLAARMIGAPALTAMGANRAGCGLVKIGAPEPILSHILTLAPNATGYPIGVDDEHRLIPQHAAAVLDQLARECEALVIGPGLAMGASVVMDHLLTLDLGNRFGAVVLDADALNALSGMTDLTRLGAIPAVLTPHPGEAVRLLEALGITGNPAGDDHERGRVCEALADTLGVIVVLKGHRTVVCDRSRRWVCQHGHPCLGTGGTGDVLSGMIASIAAQSVNDPGVDLFNAACIGVEAHARSAERWASNSCAINHSLPLQTHEGGLDPRDLGPIVPSVMHEYRSH